MSRRLRCANAFVAGSRFVISSRRRSSATFANINSTEAESRSVDAQARPRKSPPLHAVRSRQEGLRPGAARRLEAHVGGRLLLDLHGALGYAGARDRSTSR